jgi:hypothetical protein
LSARGGALCTRFTLVLFKTFWGKTLRIVVENQII